MKALEALIIAVESGLVSESDIEELIARGRARRSHAIFELVARKFDQGMTEEAIVSALEKKKP